VGDVELRFGMESLGVWMEFEFVGDGDLLPLAWTDSTKTTRKEISLSER